MIQGGREMPARKGNDSIEAWIDALPAKPRAAWSEGYLYLRSVRHARPHDAMLAVWLSVASDDRGDLTSRDNFAACIGVSRQVTYQWESRRPEIRAWAEELQFMRMHGARLAEVDERTYLAASSEDGSASDRKLFYERAGVLKAEAKLQLTGPSEGPVGIEVHAIDYRVAIAPLASGPEPDRVASGENQMPGDGPEMG